MVWAKAARVVVILAITLLIQEPVAAQTADVSGDWVLTVRTDQGVTSPRLALMQDGTALTGTYESQTLGTNDVRGSIDGSELSIRFSADIQGQPVPVSYRGTLQEDGTLSGRLDIADGAFGGTFTAVRAEPGGGRGPV